jgi:hypothetical protein
MTTLLALPLRLLAARCAAALALARGGGAPPPRLQRALATRAQQRGVPTTGASASASASASACAAPAASALAAAEALFSRIEAAVAGGELAAKNVGFALRREPGGRALVIETGAAARGGAATFRLELEGARLSLVSQKSAGMNATGGALLYRAREGDGEFVSEADGHFLVELLTRDLLHACKGVPAF